MNFIDKFFRNTGKKVHTLGIIFFFVVAIIGIILGLVWANQGLGGSGAFLVCICSPLVAYFLSLPLCLIGELAYDVHALKKRIVDDIKASDPAGNNNSASASLDELKKFKELLDQGVITEQEFQAKKELLLKLM